MRKAPGLGRLKPQPWPVSPLGVAPEWRWAWDRLVFGVPVLHGSAVPTDVVGGSTTTVTNPELIDVVAGVRGTELSADWGQDPKPNFNYPLTGLTSYPYTMACAYYETAANTNGHNSLMDVTDPSDTAVNATIGVDNDSPAHYHAAVRNGTNFSASFIDSGVAAQTLQLVTLVLRASNDRELFVDGVSVGTNTNDVPFPSPAPDTVTIGHMGDSTPSNNFGDGNFAMAAVWNRELLSSEIEQIAADPFGPFRPATRRTIVVAAGAAPNPGVTHVMGF